MTSRQVLTLDGFSIRPDGMKLSFALTSGKSIGIYGPAGSGKSQFLRAMLGAQDAVQGTVRVKAKVGWPDQSLPKRTKLQSLSRQLAEKSSLAAEMLTSSALWGARDRVLADLSSGQLAAVELLSAYDPDCGMVAIDQQFDRLDPWSLKRFLAFYRERATKGLSVVAATDRAELASFFDVVVVLQDREPKFAGSPEDLIKTFSPDVLEVETIDQRTVRALVEPFVIDVQETPTGLRLQAREGQEVAARLLSAGYGDVRYIVVRQPSIADALLHLLD